MARPLPFGLNTLPGHGTTVASSSLLGEKLISLQYRYWEERELGSLTAWTPTRQGFYTIIWCTRRLFWEGLSGLAARVLLCPGDMGNKGSGTEWSGKIIHIAVELRTVRDGN